jgi:hypothetical protein
VSRLPRTALSRRASALLVAAAVLVALAGCQSDVEHFRGDVQPLQRQALQQRAQIAATLRTVHLHSRSDAAILTRQIDALAKIYDKIAHVQPPDAAKAQFARYAQANAGVVASLHQFAVTLATGSSRQLTASSQQAQNAVGAAQRANDALDNALH